MTNEVLLLLTVLGLFSAVLLWYVLFGQKGLVAFSVFATVCANIEVLLLIEAFGLEQTLGNALFACTFLITDIISETVGKKAAQRTVYIGVASSILYLIVSQSWLLYTPAAGDMMGPSMHALFSTTPRLVLSSLIVYAVCQQLDVWLYHKIWRFSERRLGDRDRFLALRNNGSTLISQLFNSFLFNFAAFGGMYDFSTLVEISLAGYIVFVATSLIDTPFLYLARRIHKKRAARGAVEE